MITEKDKPADLLDSRSRPMWRKPSRLMWSEEFRRGPCWSMKTPSYLIRPLLEKILGRFVRI